MASVRQPVAQELGDVEIASPSLFDRVLLWVFGVLSVVAIALTSLLAASPFLISFKNVLQLQIRPLVDGGQLQDAQDIMHRTTLPEFLVIWALFIFIAISYLLVRLWAFPWAEAVSDVGRLFTRGRATSSRSTSRGPVFSPDAAFSLQSAVQPQLATASAMPGGSQALVGGTFAFTNEPRNAGRDVAEPVHETAGTTSDEATTSTVEAPDMLPMAPDVYQPVPDEAPVILTGPDDMTPAPLIGNGSGDHARDEENTQNGGQSLEGGNGLADTVEYTPTVSTNWLAGPVVEPVGEAVAPVRREQPGVVPLWAGLGLLLATTGVVALQIATGQYLLALLIALIGGIGATTLASSRSAPALFTGVLLIGALSVAMGVELVYLADHLRGGDMYRMNTVFKFYIQVSLLFGAGCAAAIYYIYYGVRDRREAQVARDELTQAPEELFTPVALAPLDEINEISSVTTGSHEHTIALQHEPAGAEVIMEAQPVLEPGPSMTTAGSLNNWLVWSDADTEAAALEQQESAAATDNANVELPAVEFRAHFAQQSQGGRFNSSGRAMDLGPNRLVCGLRDNARSIARLRRVWHARPR